MGEYLPPVVAEIVLRTTGFKAGIVEAKAEMAAASDEIGSSSKRMASNVEQSSKRVESRMGSMANRVGGSMSMLSGHVGKVGTPMNELGQHLQQVETHSRGAMSALSGLGKAVATGGLAAFAATAYESVKGAMALQASLTRLHTQAGATTAQVHQLQSGILSMAGSVGTAPQQLSQGMYHVVSALNATLPATKRVSTEMSVLKVAAEGAKVGNANLVDVTNALDAAVVSGIKGVQNYKQAMGSLNATVGAGDMTMQDLANAMGTGILASAQTAGLSLKDVGAALAVFGDNNMRGAKAANRLRMAISMMNAPSSQAAGVMRALGMSMTQLGSDMHSGGLVKALEDLKTHLQQSGATATQQGLLLSKMFGGGKTSSGVLILLNQLDRLKAKYVQLGAGASKFGADYGATTHTLQFQMHALEATVSSLADRFGMWLIPKLEDAGKAINSVVTWMGQNKGAAEALAGVIGGVLAAAVAAFAYEKAKAFVSGVSAMASGLGSLVTAVGDGATAIVAGVGRMVLAAGSGAVSIAGKFGLIGPAAATSEAGVAGAMSGMDTQLSVFGAEVASVTDEASGQMAMFATSVGTMAASVETDAAAADAAIVGIGTASAATADEVKIALGSTGIGLILIGVGTAATLMATHWGAVMKGMKSAVTAMASVAKDALHGLISLLNDLISSYNDSLGVLLGDIGKVGNVNISGSGGGGGTPNQNLTQAQRTNPYLSDMAPGAAQQASSLSPALYQQILKGKGSMMPSWSPTQNLTAAQVMSTLTSGGLSAAGAAGMVGNWAQESSFNPNYNNPAVGVGMAQWTNGRAAALKGFAAQHHEAWNSPVTQSQFALQELHSMPSLLAMLKSTSNPQAAALAISNQYERPKASAANNTNRMFQAAEALAAFGRTAALHSAAAGSAAAGSGSGSSATGSALASGKGADAAVQALLNQISGKGAISVAQGRLTSQLQALVTKYQGLASSSQQTSPWLSKTYQGTVTQLQALSSKYTSEAAGAVTTQQISALRNTLHTDLARIQSTMNSQLALDRARHVAALKSGAITTSLNAALSHYGGLKSTAQQTAPWETGAYSHLITEIQNLERTLVPQAKASTNQSQLAAVVNRMHTTLARLEASTTSQVAIANKGYTQGSSLITRLSNVAQTGAVPMLDRALGVSTAASTPNLAAWQTAGRRNLGIQAPASLEQLVAQLGTHASVHQIDQTLLPTLNASANRSQQGVTYQRTLGELRSSHQTGMANQLVAAHKAAMATLAQEMYALQETKDAESMQLQATQLKDQTQLASDMATAQLNIAKGTATQQHDVAAAQLAAATAQSTAAHDTAATALSVATAQATAAHDQSQTAVSVATAQATAAHDAAQAQVSIATAQAAAAHDAAQAQVTATKDANQLIVNAMQAAATQITDTTQVITAQFQAMTQAVTDATQQMADASGAIVTGINDQTQVKVDLLGEQGLYGLNLVAQQLQVQLDQEKAGFDQQIAAAQANVDATKATWDAQIAALQQNVAQTQLQQDQLTAAAQQNADTVQLHGDLMVGAAQAASDATTVQGIIASAAAQAVADAIGIQGAVSIGAAQANVDALSIHGAIVTGVAQANEDSIKLWSARMLASAQAKEDSVALLNAQALARAQSHIDSVTMAQDIKVQLAQSVVDLSATAPSAQQRAAQSALQAAQAQASQVEAAASANYSAVNSTASAATQQAQAAYQAAKDQTSAAQQQASAALQSANDQAAAQQQGAAAAYQTAQDQAAAQQQAAATAYQFAQDQASSQGQAAAAALQAAQDQAQGQESAAQSALTLAQAQAQAAEAQSAQALASAQGQASVAEAGAQQQLQTIQDTAAQQEATLQSQISLVQAAFQAIQRGGGTFNPYSTLVESQGGGVTLTGSPNQVPYQPNPNQPVMGESPTGAFGPQLTQYIQLASQADPNQIAQELQELMRPYLTSAATVG